MPKTKTTPNSGVEVPVSPRYIVKDTVLALLSDMHSGGSTALCLDRPWQGKHQNHFPTDAQKEMHMLFESCIAETASRRKDRRLIVVHDGDAIEGVHHHSREAFTFNKEEQSAIHTELMDKYLRGVGFHRGKGDRLYYVTGTESHTEDLEDKIAKDLRAEVNQHTVTAENPKGFHSWEHLELDVNGRRIWFVHHGPSSGSGPNVGNAMRTWLRNIYYQCKDNDKRPPDVVVTGHFHSPVWENFIRPRHKMTGILLPSWQGKTRYAYQKVPVAVNAVGQVLLEITASGEIRDPQYLTMETGSIGKVMI